METVAEALTNVKELYQKIVRRPTPELPPGACFSFPPGVDPVQYAVLEVNELQRLSEQLSWAAPTPAWIPQADVFALEDSVLIRLELPGVAREDLNVFVTGGECVIRGERKPPETELRPLALERPWGAFERRFPFHCGDQNGGIKARYQDGVLELRIPLARREVSEKSKVKVE